MITHSPEAVIDLSKRLDEMLKQPEQAPAIEIPEPGVYRDMPMAQYVALPLPGASKLERLRRSPLQYQHSLTETQKSSSALERGTAIHLAVLEPLLFEGHYVVLGPCQGTKKDHTPCTYQGSIYRQGASWCKTHDPERGQPLEDVEVLSQADYDAVLGARDAIRAHPRARSLFEGRGDFEVTIIFDDPETGVRCKIRPDRLVDRARMLVDIKSTRDGAPWAFPRQAETLGYFRKLALYRRGLRAIGWPYESTAVLAIEATPPFDLCPYLPEEEDLDTADVEVTRLLRILKTCEETGVWGGYAENFQPLRRPRWALQEDEHA